MALLTGSVRKFSVVRDVEVEADGTAASGGEKKTERVELATVRVAEGSKTIKLSLNKQLRMRDVMDWPAELASELAVAIHEAVKLSQ